MLGLFANASAATDAARALHALGIRSDQISVVARDHAEARALAEQMHATLGVELEDSPRAARLGELTGRVLAAIAVVMPGVGPIVAAGPLAAQLGEAAGHAAGSLSSILSTVGVPAGRAELLQREVGRGGVLLGVHVEPSDVDRVRETLASSGSTQLETAHWP